MSHLHGAGVPWKTEELRVLAGRYHQGESNIAESILTLQGALNTNVYKRHGLYLIFRTENLFTHTLEEVMFQETPARKKAKEITEEHKLDDVKMHPITVLDLIAKRIRVPTGLSSEKYAHAWTNLYRNLGTYKG